jgi:hypothetical protein
MHWTTAMRCPNCGGDMEVGILTYRVGFRDSVAMGRLGSWGLVFLLNEGAKGVGYKLPAPPWSSLRCGRCATVVVPGTESEPSSGDA